MQCLKSRSPGSSGRHDRMPNFFRIAFNVERSAPLCAKGAKVSRPIVLLQPGELEARERIVHVHLDEQEALVVAEADVVLRAEILDEPAFEENGLGLAAHDVPLEIPDAVDERPGLQVDLRRPGRREIVREAFPKIAGLAHVDDPLEPVAHNVDPRLVRDVPEAGLMVGLYGGFGHSPHIAPF